MQNKHLQIILENPETVCDQLSGDLSGIYSYHFKFNRIQYRISYIIEEYEKSVYILSISKRESFYQILKRRIKSRI
ncbi:MAG: type II toxin-antitoxin system RelE/ParE family toxin [Candidatus Cloacimonetes bacterium]|nr:type II toxin-antitoxin system RelE/ParE family toxin [Candidatus Cloacimonadota bacterium]